MSNQTDKPDAGRRGFSGSAAYWEDRYTGGGHSGAGSYDALAAFKAEFLNAYVEQHGINHVLEFGCGDGNQLSLASYPRYTGLDVSQTAVKLCRQRFADDPSRTFMTVDAWADARDNARTAERTIGSAGESADGSAGESAGERADLVLSLDVIYHLVEDEVFEGYMADLFDAADGHVIIYSSNHDEAAGTRGSHVRQRRFSTWIERERVDWRLSEHVPNRYPYSDDQPDGSIAEFYVYTR